MVHNFEDIGRATENEKAWNNLEDSGCNIICLAMIIGVDPAYLVSEIRKQADNFFVSDDAYPAERINVKNGNTTDLVWDRNNPNKDQQSHTLFFPFPPIGAHWSLTITRSWL